MSTRLREWWTLPDFAAFRNEVQKSLKADIPLKARNEWEAWLSDTRIEIDALTAEITGAERQINELVYSLFELTAEEVSLLEANV